MVAAVLIMFFDKSIVTLEKSCWGGHRAPKRLWGLAPLRLLMNHLPLSAGCFSQCLVASRSSSITLIRGNLSLRSIRHRTETYLVSSAGASPVLLCFVLSINKTAVIYVFGTRRVFIMRLAKCKASPRRRSFEPASVTFSRCASARTNKDFSPPSLF